MSDFTLTPRVLPIAALAIGIGVISCFVAVALLKLIGFFTNLFFYQRIGFYMTSPAENHLGLWVIVVPAIGGLIVGFMARYGSDKIRGHGIPEAIESILLSGSRVPPNVAVLKPVSSAIAIGSGGPFGAEGPIIMTGGAFGSVLAQLLNLSSTERKTLLVSGAAAGMSAVFAAPVAAVLLAVELLLFEWKPRSIIPVVLASATAGLLRRFLMASGGGPLFPVPEHNVAIGATALLGIIIVGIMAGVLSAILTQSIYKVEDAFAKLPIHWMWWPTLGGLVVGIGGYLMPQALGVGYDVIDSLLQGNMALHLVIGILFIKAIIWAIALGSGTSGGVLAPVLMVGAALGACEGYFLPNQGAGFWALLSMGAVLGGTMRAPFTGVIFALELTHDINLLLPLLLATALSYGFTVLTQKRSILTEKIARRGYHLSCEYAIDPLEILFVREVMKTAVTALPASITREELTQKVEVLNADETQLLYPVIDGDLRMAGVVTRRKLIELMHNNGATVDISQILERDAVHAYPDETLKTVVLRMSETGLTRLPVLDRDTHQVVGLVTLRAVLAGRAKNLEAENRRERVLPLRLRMPFRLGAAH
jgi:H+/Cl- antiporter ClcA/predicted transcriptional regulator